MNLLALLFAGIAAVHHFGFWDGLGIAAGLYVLMPWHPRSQ